MMNLCWENVDFSDGFFVNEEMESKSFMNDSDDSNIKRTFVTIGTALLILAGMLIVAWAGVSLYTRYTSHKEVQQAIQMAKDENRQLNVITNNGFNITINISHKSSLSLAGESTGITSVTVYPRNYNTERIRFPNGQVHTPYSL